MIPHKARRQSSCPTAHCSVLSSQFSVLSTHTLRSQQSPVLSHCPVVSHQRLPDPRIGPLASQCDPESHWQSLDLMARGLPSGTPHRSLPTAPCPPLPAHCSLPTAPCPLLSTSHSAPLLNALRSPDPRIWPAGNHGSRPHVLLLQQLMATG